MSTTTLPCGCKHDDRSWLVLCEPHLLQWWDTRRIAGGVYRPVKSEWTGGSEEVQ
jgi:hypothetical protein